MSSESDGHVAYVARVGARKFNAVEDKAKANGHGRLTLSQKYACRGHYSRNKTGQDSCAVG
jgi:hypothetical protein